MRGRGRAWGGGLIHAASGFGIRTASAATNRCRWIESDSDALGLPPDELGPVFEGWAARYRFERAFVMTSPPEREKPPTERYLAGAPGWREVARGRRAVMFERVP